MNPEVRYATSGDLSIAYQVVGDGPVDIVYAPGFITHADLMWDMPLQGTLLRSLARFARVVCFDKRGTGLSDRDLGLGSTAERMDDVRAVMDAAGVERAVLMGVSEGGPLVELFAATYPDRCAALVLLGTYARATRGDGYDIGVSPEAVEPFLDGVERTWGTGNPLRLFVTGVPDDPETQRMLARYERACASPRMVRQILTRNVEMDTRDALSSINAPTLVIHHVGDPIVPVECGRYLAEHIGDARLLELPGDYHLSGAPGGEAEAIEAIEEFLTGERQEHNIDRVLKTVLFSDIVGSTQHLAELGDRQWKELLDAHDQAARAEVERRHGVVVNTAGDGFLAAFDGPARAVMSASALHAAAGRLGLQLRIGAHTGECEVRGPDLAGMAVHIGARVSGLAEPGETLVTGTVRDLVVGGDIDFVDRGTKELKGVPGTWSLLAVA